MENAVKGRGVLLTIFYRSLSLYRAFWYL